MVGERQGRDLFIVDNSVSGWTGLRYLEEWCGIAKAFDNRCRGADTVGRAHIAEALSYRRMVHVR